MRPLDPNVTFTKVTQTANLTGKPPPDQACIGCDPCDPYPGTGPQRRVALRICGRVRRLPARHDAAQQAWPPCPGRLGVLHGPRRGVGGRGHGKPGGYLCIGCLEARLGRRLTPADFPEFPVNQPDRFTSARLLDRLQGIGQEALW